MAGERVMLHGSDLGCLHCQDVQNLSVAFSNDARDATKKMVKCFLFQVELTEKRRY